MRTVHDITHAEWVTFMEVAAAVLNDAACSTTAYDEVSPQECEATRERMMLAQTSIEHARKDPDIQPFYMARMSAASELMGAYRQQVSLLHEVMDRHNEAVECE